MAQSKDTRPTRSKHKDRSVRNKIKQIEQHVYSHPSDKYGKEKLERAKGGNSRAVCGVGPKRKIPELGKHKKGRR